MVNSIPGFLVPGFLVPGLLVPGLSTNSYTRSRDRPGRTQQTGIFCGKSFIAYIFRSQRARERKRTRTRKQEKEWQNPVPFKENYPPPRTYYSLIGCSPSAQLSSRERQNTWRENCPCMCACIFMCVCVCVCVCSTCCTQSSIAYIFRSQSAREQEREWRNPIPFKENYPPPRTYYSLIGCSPSAELSSRGRQSTWSEELPLAHAQIICLPLRTQDVSAILQRRM